MTSHDRAMGEIVPIIAPTMIKPWSSIAKGHNPGLIVYPSLMEAQTIYDYVLSTKKKNPGKTATKTQLTISHPV